MASERRRVTVIDDHEELLELVADVLAEPGYVVTAIHGAPEDIDEVARTLPDLLIVDLRLEGRSARVGGWELIQLVRADERLRDVPILICSADVRELRRRQAEIARLPRASVLQKPFGVAELESAVEAALMVNGNGGSAHAC